MVGDSWTPGRTQFLPEALSSPPAQRALPKAALAGKGPSKSTGRAAGWGSQWVGLLQDPSLGTQNTLGSQGAGSPHAQWDTVLPAHGHRGASAP